MLICLWFAVALGVQAQSIQMYWPHLAGKTYEFILFQGNAQLKVQQDTIPADGRFMLVVPSQYAPYTGMCRWLITGSSEGGGLDMAIQGHNFAVACTEKMPSEQSIKYDGYDAVNELNKLYRAQEIIVNKHRLAGQALQLYTASEPLYATFQQEQRTQAKVYADFRKNLRLNPRYVARFLPIVSLTRGLAPQLLTDENDLAKCTEQFIYQELNMEDLYTSGHWSSVIMSWIQIHKDILNNPDTLANHFIAISNRIKKPEVYRAFVEEIAYGLNYMGKDAWIEKLAPTVLQSGKLSHFDGRLQVFLKGVVNTQAPNILLANGSELKSRELAIGNYEQTLLVFYHSDCDHCETVLASLKNRYAELKAKGIRIISIDAETQTKVFQEKSNSLPWIDKYQDLQEAKVTNFINYAVQGTPTLIRLDKRGIIKARTASLEEAL